MIYEDPIEWDMIISYPYDVNDEEWINNLATIVEDETPLNIKYSFHMQMVHYDEEFENTGPHISDDASMISPSYLSNIREACYMKDSLADVQPMTSSDY